ncbi:DUF302 domain-containing protein [Deinococcus pimensis]|uniref:DUF302 domain-containing protein n=1 Tax=Deinococcus pimensis TaxID=309888 RepID=UPI0004AD3001|nr:DUF302 domain-containing protein [Deinococcus pimensis]
MTLEPNDQGVLVVRSAYLPVETVDRLEAVLRSKQFRVFARIDQALEAEQVGLTLRPTILVLFGDPRSGTALMQASTTAALDLPLRVVAWQDEQGGSWVTYDDPQYLGRRHHLPDALIANISGIHTLVKAATT